MKMLPVEPIKSGPYWERAMVAGTAGNGSISGQSLLTHPLNEVRLSMGPIHSLPSIQRPSHIPEQYNDSGDASFDPYGIDKDRKFSSLTKFFLNRAEKTQIRSDNERNHSFIENGLPSSELRDFAVPSLEQLGNVTQDDVSNVDSSGSSASPKKGKVKGKSKKSVTVKRKCVDEGGPVRKKATPMSIPTFVNCPERLAEIEALEKVDALTLALEMGYTNPHDTIGDSVDDKDDDEVSKKVSPVENIQQVLDYRKTSGCSCLSALTIQDVAAHRLEITSLDRQSRDFFIMGLFRSAAVPTTVTTRNSDRQRYRFNYRLLNTRICQICFLFVNDIGAKYMKNLKKHFNEMGVRSRTHGNQGRKPHHALRDDDVENVADFIVKYGTIHGIPNKSPKGKGKKNNNIIRLPAAHTFTSVFKEYRELCEHTEKRGIAASTFRKIWSSHAAHIKVVQQSTLKESPPTPNIRNSKKTVSPGTSPHISKSSSVSSKESAVKSESTNANPDLVDPSSKKPTYDEMIEDSDKKSQVKNILEDNNPTTSAPSTSQPNDGHSIPVNMSVSFDFSTVDMPTTPMMPLGLYLNESPATIDSWQQNLLLPNIPTNQHTNIQTFPKRDIVRRLEPEMAHALPATHSMDPAELQQTATDQSSQPKYEPTATNQSFHQQSLEGPHW